MSTKMVEDEDFKRLKTKLYNLRSRRLLSWPWGGIDLLKDKTKVKIDRAVLEALLDDLEGADNLKGSLFHFLGIEDYVDSQTENLVTQREYDSDRET